MAVRPAVAGTEPEGEDAPFLDVHALQEVGDEAVAAVVADQPRVPVDHHQAHVLGPAHQQPQLSPVLPRREPVSGERDDQGTRRQALRHRGNPARRDFFGESRGLDVRVSRRLRARERGDKRRRGQTGNRPAGSRPVGRVIDRDGSPPPQEWPRPGK